MLALTPPNGVYWRPLGFSNPESTYSQLNRLSDPSCIGFCLYHLLTTIQLMQLKLSKVMLLLCTMKSHIQICRQLIKMIKTILDWQWDRQILKPRNTLRDQSQDCHPTTLLHILFGLIRVQQSRERNLWTECHSNDTSK